ncbi:hypothetical protein C5748_03590 [Phyllobacterium phragmitis]|uniref:Uncharacterized protein n=1 Tax=Phyllobacterium phragmitis TaxID=2670329 RepID=A0A2S9IXP0_9HYPH|nr:hypothetical protein [Phyllobacterium phragmitis]PRD45293.1 hypothetical protein C5748_03590 [Phyllobacterium phragmitis]
MSETSEKVSSAGAMNRLSDAVRTAKIAAADRGDVVVDMKEADRARLELLAQDLQPVFDDVPSDDPQWDFALSTGLQPRLWIDATSHVMMARDRRTYRFVRDTRLGRIVIVESTEIKPVSDAVTAYIAERIVERERLLEGDLISLRGGVPVSGPQATEVEETPAPVSVQAAALAEAPRRQSRWAGFVAGLVWFLIGALVAGGLVLALLQDRIGLVI